MLKLVINKNKEIAYNKINNIFKTEGYDKNNIDIQNEFMPKNSKGLFDIKQAIFLDLSNKSDMDKFKKRITSKKDNIKNEIIKQDVIIFLNTLQGTKKFEDFVKDLNGEIIKDKEVDIDEMLQDYPLNYDTKSFIIDYIAQSSEKILPLINTLDKMSEKEIKNLDVENIFSIMPSKPGEVPPFQFLDSMIKGDVKKTIYEFERITKTTHEIVCLAILKKKIQTIQQAHYLRVIEHLDYKEVANVINSHPYPIKLLWHITGNEKQINRLVKLITDLEYGLKGASKINANDLFKRYLVDITLTIRSCK